MMPATTPGSTKGASISATKRHFGQSPHQRSATAADSRNAALQLQKVEW